MATTSSTYFTTSEIDDFCTSVAVKISCELRNTVCLMGGLAPAPAASPGSGPGFTIVQGAGLPNLSVVGYNRLVDWPVLLERLSEVGKGNIKPVVQ